MAQDTFWKGHWDRRRTYLANAKEKGLVLFKVQGERLQVSAPHNPEFVTGARELDGRWRHRTQQWSFPLVSKRLVKELAERVYGAHNLKGDV